MAIQSLYMEDEAWIEEAIAKELELLADDKLTDDSDDVLLDKSLDDPLVNVPEDDLIPSMLEYISKIQLQSEKFESELAECDAILQESDIVSARRTQDDELEQIAREQGLTVEQLKQQVLRAIEEEERQEEAEELGEVATQAVTDLLVFAQQSAREEANSGAACDSADQEDELEAFMTALQTSALDTSQTAANTNESSTEDADSSDAKPVEDLSAESSALVPYSGKQDESREENALQPSTLEPGAGVVAVVQHHELLERALNAELRQMEARYRQLHTQRNQERQAIQAAVEERQNQTEQLRMRKKQELLEEGEALVVQAQERESSLRQEAEQLQRQIEQSLEEYEKEINELARQTEREKAEFLAERAKEAQRVEESRARAAVKIQTCYRGYRARREHGAEVKVACERVKERRVEEQVATAQRRIEERHEKERIEKEEEERKRMEEEEKKGKEEELRQQKLEEERLKKEEEKRRKEEEKQRKAEEERLRKEEEKRRKEEEKRRKEEEKRKKEEEERLRKEEEKRRKEEEKRRKEEEKRKKEEEKKQKEEEKQRQEEEKKRKEEEERKRKEEEARKVEEKKAEEQRKLEEGKQKLEDEQNVKDDKETQKQAINDSSNHTSAILQVQAVNSNTVSLTPVPMNVTGEKGTATPRGMTELLIDQVANVNTQDAPKTTHTTHSSPSSKTPRPPSAPKPENSFERPISGRRKSANQNSENSHVASDTPISVDNTRRKMEDQKQLAGQHDWGEFLPMPIEAARLHWIGKQCKALSTIVSEHKTRRHVANRKPARRPASAKSLPALEERAILTATRAHSLSMVTTVELCDLPGCSLQTLAQCRQLRALRMRRCGLVTTEGLETCAHLAILDLQHNRLELVTLKDARSLIYADLSHNELSSVHGLDNCTALRYLSLAHNKITRFSGLSTLTQLHTLDASHNQLITSRDLLEAPSVQRLDVSHNHLASLDGLDNLALLQELWATANNLMQIPKLSNQVLLKTCDLSDNSISFLSAFSQTWLPLLNSINLSQNSISVLDPMLNFLLLENLDLSQNQLLDLSELEAPLQATRCLLTLNVADNPITTQPGYRERIVGSLPFLETLDGSPVSQSCARRDGKAERLSRTQFEQMCEAQSLQVRQLDRAYQAALSSSSDLLTHMHVHEKYFTTSATLAADIRYTHEYGVTMVTPKPISCDFTNLSVGTGIFDDQDEDLVDLSSNVHTGTAAQNAIEKGTPHREGISESRNKFDSALKHTNGPSLSAKNAFEAKVTASFSKPTDISKASFENLLKQSSEPLTTHNTPGARPPAGAKALFEARLQNGSVKATVGGAPGAVTCAQAQSRDMKSRFDAALAGGGGRGGESGDARVRRGQQNGLDSTGQTGNTVNSSKSFGTNVTTSQVMQLLASSNGDYAQILHYSATKIQAAWRGYVVRRLLARALSFGRWGDEDDDEDLENFDQDIDLDAFNFDMDAFEKDLLVPDSPQLPKQHAVLGKPPSGPPSSRRPAAVPPLSMPRGADTPIGGVGVGGVAGRSPLPPLSSSRLSDAHTEATSRVTGRSRREEQLTQEWGFKDTKTAELMLNRARKLKYNALKRKKLSQLDPTQRLALYRRLEEATRVKVPAVSRHTVPRKEYFQAREEEIRRADAEVARAHMDHVAAVQEEASRTFEWVHTQAGPVQYDLNSSRVHPSKSSGDVGGVGERNLPRMDPSVLAGGRAMLAGSPASLDLQSVESGSTLADPASRPQRLWRTTPTRPPAAAAATTDALQLDSRLPPIDHVGSASSKSSSGKGKERVSFRNPKTEVDVGWGGGRRRNKIRN